MRNRLVLYCWSLNDKLIHVMLVNTVWICVCVCTHICLLLITDYSAKLVCVYLFIPMAVFKFLFDAFCYSKCIQLHILENCLLSLGGGVWLKIIIIIMFFDRQTERIYCQPRKEGRAFAPLVYKE